MDKRSVILFCIFSNLLVGNGIIFCWSWYGGSVNWDLMIGMSLSCILCYLLVFRYINFKKWSFLKILILSLLTCVAIQLVGCSFASVVTGFRKDDVNFLYTIFMGLGVGFVLGIIGNMLMFPITIIMGAANLFWFRKYQMVD
ncbi:hypothetical protein G7051_11860 [Dysgonomonas sp. HDW5B]|uniref:hypothetical protein n=1 Tax=Dysgonomonas sp. HDW5B TaxID=2714927 RepID=UPI0014087C92|nr:hypothetical protein [Dysgonomonas sp. HDW5B]QIK54994.1 hypothetical protein G7051_11860 [Dysgonomonas sp. HDW5B]